MSKNNNYRIINDEVDLLMSYGSKIKNNKRNEQLSENVNLQNDRHINKVDVVYNETAGSLTNK